MIVKILPTALEDLDRVLAKRFPYAVYYKVDGETCIVYRVLDCRQEQEKTTEGLR